jgi:hypothetical protein
MVRSVFGIDRRAQVLLVGALAIAFVIIGLAVLFNAVTYTGQTSIPEAGSPIEDATQFDYEARRGSRELVLRVSHSTVYSNEAELARNVSWNVSTYSAVMGATYATHGATVNVSFKNTSSDYGRRIVQNQSENFTSKLGTPEWELVNSSDRLGWFAVTINATDIVDNQASAFTINVTNETDYVEYRIYGSSSKVNVSVATSVGSANGPYEFNTTRGHVILNFLDGTSPMNQSTQIPSVRRLDGPYNVSYKRGNRASGLYSIVVPSTGPIDGSIDACSSSMPCHSPAIWNVSVKTHYETPTVNVTHNKTIPVYNSTS